MSWLVIASKDFQDAVRSRWLWGLSAVFLGLVTLTAAVLSVLPREFILLVLLGRFGEEVTIDSSLVLFAMNGLIITLLVPLIALVMSHNAVSGERESGSLKLLLSLPHSRSDVIVGKILGRAGAIVAAIVIGFLLPGLVMAIVVPFQAVEYVGYILLVGALATVFVSIGVGISAAVETEWRALAASIGLFLLFIILWVPLQFVGGFAIGILAGQWPEWMPLTFVELRRVLTVINPTGAFKIVSGAFLNGQLFAPGADPNLQLAAASMLLFWFMFPLLVGTWRFETVDL